jgi:hypothetical protein
MKINSNAYDDIEEIKKEMDELNILIDKKCLDIYNQNVENENKIFMYKTYMENVILEYHKICKILFSEKNN